MKKSSLLKTALFLFTVGFAAFAQAQTRLSVSISSNHDDMEEYVSGANQTKTVGSFDSTSSDLELGNESFNGTNTSDPQLVGLRFSGITIPKGAKILNAYVEFTIDAVNKNANPTQIVIKAQWSDNAGVFLPWSLGNMSGRTKTADSVLWNIANTEGTVVGSKLKSQNISSLVQSIINRGGWQSGNAVALFFSGSGLREVESYESGATSAAKLVIDYIVPTVTNIKINSNYDDMEEYIAGPNQNQPLGTVDSTSSDLELGNEGYNGGIGQDPQLVGVRFNGLGIPKGSEIANAYLEFTIDATNKNISPTQLTIRAQDAANASPFIPYVTANMSSRSMTPDSVQWTISGTEGTVVGSKLRSSNIATLVQYLVNKGTWATGNSVAFFLKGSGLREVESFESGASTAATLVVEYFPIQTVSYRVNANNNDLEEYIAGSNQTKTIGDVDSTSSDLELGNESNSGGVTADPQLVGVRFTNIAIPQNAIVKNAFIEFTIDATSKNANPSNLVIRAENAENAGIFKPYQFADMSNRSKLSDSITWNILSTEGTTVGQVIKTPNLKVLVDQIITKSGWNSGNAMAFYIKGTGLREVESFEGDAPKAANLVIEYVGDGNSGGSVVITPFPIGNYPIAKKSNWMYFDKGTNLPSNWTDTAFADSTWKWGAAPLGYGENDIATALEFGSAGNKRMSYYFRRKIRIPSLNAVSDTLELNLRVDDGAVVYINGREVFRRSMPTGNIDSSTAANKRSDAPNENVFFTYDVPKNFLRQGLNVVAVRVHQFDALSSDLAFDLELRNRTHAIPKLKLACNGASDAHISCITSLLPTDQRDTATIPTTHKFQMILKQGEAYKNAAGNIPGAHDFTGYVGKKGSSRSGYLLVNHETNPLGGVTAATLHFDCNKGYWMVDSSQPVDFGGELVRTERNCSGGITPWGTVITSEETMTAGDANSDGYVDVGWNVEIDPVTKRVVDYNKDGKRDKMWATGRISHENVVVANDSVTLYEGEDDGSGNLFKFVADKKGDLSSGKLYVLKLDSGLVNNEPRANKGIWVLVPNTTIAERNATKALAAGLGGTFFSGIEDVEISPLDKKIYFTAKGNNRVYRFKDNGTTATEFETFVGGRSYRINAGNESVSEEWGNGNDNLTFDDRGNLYVLQDGSRNHIWLVRADHTQSQPKVEIFMVSPAGSEPTGMTFSPDYKWMFVSIQGPNGNLTQVDAEGKTVRFNQSATMIISRAENWKGMGESGFTVNNLQQCRKGNAFNVSDTTKGVTSYAWTFGNGAVASNKNASVSYSNAGNYKIALKSSAVNGCNDTSSKWVRVLPSPQLFTIAGNREAEKNSTENYAYQTTPGSSYVWRVVNGTIQSGAGTGNISVKWGNTSTGQVKVIETNNAGCKGDTSYITVLLATAASASDLTAIPDLKVYPNPANQWLNIEGTGLLKVELVSSTGTVVLSAEGKNEIRLSMEAVSSGLYKLRVHSLQGMVTTSVIKP